MFFLRNKKNYLSIILNTPSYLELWSEQSRQELEVRGDIWVYLGIVFVESALLPLI